MARLASTLEGRELPAPDDPQVRALVPQPAADSVIAVAADGRPIGAAWRHVHEPPLVRDAEGTCVPSS